MIKGTLFILLLSGESRNFESDTVFMTLQACRDKGVEAITSIKDMPDLVGVGFTCEPAGVTG